jgi:predicted nucleic acid-binding protein
MSVPAFVDTNILVYADDRSASAKRDRSQKLIQELLRGGRGWISVQVLQEYYSAATRKLGMQAGDARRRVELYTRFGVAVAGASDVLGAIDLHRLHQFSIWDALIVRTALISGCRILYSEDLQAGFRVENLEVVNPFK